MRNIAKIAAIGGIGVAAAIVAKKMNDRSKKGRLPESLDSAGDRTEPRYEPGNEPA